MILQDNKRTIFFILCVLCILFFYPLGIKADQAEISLPKGKVLTAIAAVGNKPVSLIPFLSYAYNLEARDAKSALAQKNKFMPYDPVILKRELGTYWFLISFNKIKDKNAPTAYLDLGNFLPKNSHVLVFSNATNRWQVLEDVYTEERKKNGDNFNVDREKNIGIFHSGLYDLTALRDGGELLIYSPGMPSIWFAPKLISPANAPLTLDRRLTPILMGLIFILMIFTFWRGAREEGDARIWAAFLCLAVMVQYIWAVPQNANGKLEYIDMIGIIASCMAIFFLPHIGRHLLVTEKKSPHFDSLLQFLAIPAIIPLIVLFVPIPEYLYIIRFAPLWGLYALVLFVLTIPFVLSGKKGAKLYAFFCLVIGGSCLVSLALRFNPEWFFINYLGVVVAMIAIFLAPRQTEKNIYDEKLNHEDIVTAFAENNAIMRDALYRVEGKLRNPFDRIMREACFLDFNLKTEELTDSLALLHEKEFGDKFEKHSLHAVDDIVKRSERLQEHTTSLVLACRDLSSMLGNITELAQKEPNPQQVHELFNIKNLVMQACDTIRTEAQDRQVGLGWYIAPNIGLNYRGDKAGLELVLSLLLRDAIRATEKGMISVRVRRANSPNPGHIIITINDSGKGRPPVQRSILTLIKAWELSSAYNGEVELHSSPNGLSFSFSLQCLAMDQNGEKPLSYASLDDIVLTQNEIVHNMPKHGLSGGNIVFSKDEESQVIQENIPQDFVGNQKDTGILLISPLAIQRQNIAYYLNKYEIWEALDVDSALAFYEKKPASLVLVHSALSENGCNAVIAGIRLLEDSLGIAHAPCVGLYQSVKDKDFLQLAGCKHTLPDNIGREDLCTAVAEILEDKSIAPITDVEMPHQVIKKAQKEVEKAVKKQINRQRVYVGTVVDGAVSTSETSSVSNGVSSLGTSNFVVNEEPIKKEQEIKTVQYNEEQNSQEKEVHTYNYSSIKKEKPRYENTIDFQEEKKGFWGTLLGGLRPKPHKSIQEENFPDDELVGDPKPLDQALSREIKNDTSFEVVDENSFIKPKKESSSLEKQEEREEKNSETNDILKQEDEVSSEERKESNIQNIAEHISTNIKDHNAIAETNNDENNSDFYEEDVPPQGLQLLLDNIADVETIKENSVFVQSGLINSDELVYENVKEYIEDKIDELEEKDEQVMSSLTLLDDQNTYSDPIKEQESLVSVSSFSEQKNEQEEVKEAEQEKIQENIKENTQEIFENKSDLEKITSIVQVEEDIKSKEENIKENNLEKLTLFDEQTINNNSESIKKQNDLVLMLSLSEQEKIQEEIKEAEQEKKQENIKENIQEFLEKKSELEEINTHGQDEQVSETQENKGKQHTIIDLSTDMLVETGLMSFDNTYKTDQPVQKKNNKKWNKKHKKQQKQKEKNSQYQNTSLDIMLDYSNSVKKREQESNQQNSYDTLSFFPMPNNEKKE
ncbi:hypothetical protein [Peptacetobacter sp.]|uniref:hypothetical protein n=1 Tax=Peptacetobacter sp. TaxID=2991975 RepID=UPI0026121A46|nr:hypothetical protein [Peptacetobacter sp.]